MLEFQNVDIPKDHSETSSMLLLCLVFYFSLFKEEIVLLRLLRDKKAYLPKICPNDHSKSEQQKRTGKVSANLFLLMIFKLLLSRGNAFCMPICLSNSGNLLLKMSLQRSASKFNLVTLGLLLYFFPTFKYT